jgi:polar amino acid transport system substrate-binding protein
METAMKKQWFFLAALCFCLFPEYAHVGGTMAKTQVSDPRVADLVRAGRVRVALYLPQYTKDAVTGELRGWPIDLVRALGERLGIEGVPVEHPTPPHAIACLKSGDCDVAILGIDPTRATEVDYSPPFAQLEYTYLVPDRSSIRSIADTDRSGLRIAVTRQRLL